MHTKPKDGQKTGGTGNPTLWRGQLPLLQRIINEYYDHGRGQIKWVNALADHPEWRDELQIVGTKPPARFGVWLSQEMKPDGSLKRPEDHANGNGHAPEGDTALPAKGGRKVWITQTALITELLGKHRLDNGWIDWPKLIADPAALPLGPMPAKTVKQFKHFSQP